MTNLKSSFICKEYQYLFNLTTLHVGKHPFSFEMVSLSPVCEEMS